MYMIDDAEAILNQLFRAIDIEMIKAHNDAMEGWDFDCNPARTVCNGLQHSHVLESQCFTHVVLAISPKLELIPTLHLPW